MRVLLITGDPASGKTTLEMNLRRAICGTWLTTERFQISEQDGARICFVGETAKQCRRWRSPIMLPGADSMAPEKWEDLPEADTYVLHNATGCTTKGGNKTLELAERANVLLVMCLYTSRRQRNMEKRQILYGRKPSQGDRKAQHSFDRGPQVRQGEQQEHFDTGNLIEFRSAYCKALGWLAPALRTFPYFDVDIVKQEVERWQAQRRSK